MFYELLYSQSDWKRGRGELRGAWLSLLAVAVSLLLPLLLQLLWLSGCSCFFLANPAGPQYSLTEVEKRATTVADFACVWWCGLLSAVADILVLLILCD